MVITCFSQIFRALDVSIGSIRVILVFKEPMDDVSGEIMKATLSKLDDSRNLNLTRTYQ